VALVSIDLRSKINAPGTSAVAREPHAANLFGPAASGDGDFGTEVDVLDGVEKLDAFLHGALESFAAGDEAGAAGALVDDGSGDGFLEIVCAGSTSAVDQARAAHVAIGNLIARQVNGMIAAEIGVDALVKFAIAGIAHVEGLIAAVIFRELLLDDIGLNGHAEMVGLAGEVGGEVIVLVLLKGIVAQIAPKNGGHAELMGVREGLADLDDLTGALVGAEIDSGPDGGSAHVVSLLNGAEEHLVEPIGEGEQFIVIDFHNERDFVGVLARDRTENAECGSDGVAAAFDGELDDVAAVEIIRIFREARAAGVLDALVHGENRKIAGAAKAAVAEHALQIGKHANVAISRGVNAIDEVRAREMETLLGDFRRLEPQQGVGFCAEIGFNFSRSCSGCHFFFLVFPACPQGGQLFSNAS
jgi:hypothetical protein